MSSVYSGLSFRADGVAEFGVIGNESVARMSWRARRARNPARLAIRMRGTRRGVVPRHRPGDTARDLTTSSFICSTAVAAARNSGLRRARSFSRHSEPKAFADDSASLRTPRLPVDRYTPTLDSMLWEADSKLGVSMEHVFTFRGKWLDCWRRWDCTPWRR